MFSLPDTFTVVLGIVLAIFIHIDIKRDEAAGIKSSDRFCFSEKEDSIGLSLMFCASMGLFLNNFFGGVIFTAAGMVMVFTTLASEKRNIRAEIFDVGLAFCLLGAMQVFFFFNEHLIAQAETWAETIAVGGSLVALAIYRFSKSPHLFLDHLFRVAVMVIFAKVMLISLVLSIGLIRIISATQKVKKMLGFS